MREVLFRFLHTCPLNYAEDCHLLGANLDGELFVEEVYGDGWFAQHHFAADGRRLAEVDEAYGAFDVDSIPLPLDLIVPSNRDIDSRWTFSGARVRGLRLEERIADLVQPLTIAEKSYLTNQLCPQVAVPQWLGIASSAPLAVAIVKPDVWLVCRRVQLAYALPHQRMDAEGWPYDYDVATLWLLQSYTPQDGEPPPISSAICAIDGQYLHRPLDCLLAGKRFFVADGGSDGRLSAVHVWATSD